MAAAELSEQQLENRRKAFDFADSWAKLLSSLATGTIVLSATFLKDILPKDHKIQESWLLFVAWAVFTASALFGPMVLSALIAHLNRPDSARQLDVYAGTIRLFGSLQFLTFFAGIVIFSLFAGLNL